MYLEHITVFLNLTETMSFSKTALNMHMSQSSVSQAISTLEKNLGLRLS
ncbi:MAG: LysR family transcriptional regulator [Acinetobacter sp.]|nr:LysR family transcriptional regulator [Acinetobacter sp.]